ncbi:hypothetical protein HMPREF9336_03196 [Segniliparus rugosus ATCC BAA-974]|uniref:Lipoprotein n=2 Tax=Segniliparus rugosus TaxID=286804 RepID=E5XUM4_SEGRC|nr:hypothetical protein HMPREF9336_03196 [Segniliparus rugosus ATCC BAA-974]
MRTFRPAVFGAFAVALAVSGCTHFDKPEAMTPVRDASTGAVVPVTTSSVSPVDPNEAKKTFCDVYSQEIKKAEDTTTRFGAASAGDEQHPNTNWDDPDHWFADMANDAGIIFGYAADTLQGQITSSLPADLSEKAKALVASMRRLSDLYAKHSAVRDIKSETLGNYASSADAIDKLCGIS